MSKSNRNGRALEYAYLHSLVDKLGITREVIVEQNSSLLAATRAWNSIDNDLKNLFLLAASAGIDAIIEAEPLILEDGNDSLHLKLQCDNVGIEGDVRDVLIIRRDINWEIGISIKNNHFAVKHSRLSKNLDFCKKWFGVNCSDNYWLEIKPIFDYLESKQIENTKWSDLPSKDDTIYKPLLVAFINELTKKYSELNDLIPKKLVEYLIGKHDFYKNINLLKKRITQVQPFNFQKTLGKKSKSRKSKILIPVAKFPTRIISIGFKPNSKNTIELFLDEGWQFTFRIHNARTLVESSLKFDIQTIGMPTSIICLEYKW